MEHIEGTSISKGSRLKIWNPLGTSKEHSSWTNVGKMKHKENKAEFQQLLCFKSADWASFNMIPTSLQEHNILLFGFINDLILIYYM